MNQKQIILVIVSFSIALLLIAASMFMSDTSDDDDDTTQVVATFYPLAYMAETIGGERVTVSCLIPYNTEIHSFSPTAQNIIDADSADVLLYNGGPGDSWLVDDVIPAIDVHGTLVVNTTLGVEYIWGEPEEDEGGEGLEIDPHTWLSPKEAIVQAKNVYEALCEADPDGADYFLENYETLNGTLTQLNEDYQDLTESNVTTIIVSHAAFGYVAYDYNFTQEGAIGLSGDEEPSVATITALVDLMTDQGIYTVFTEPGFADTYANTIESTVESQTGHDVKLLDLYLMIGPVDDMDYLEQMSQNLINLKIGLGIA
jgi:zinc transport system substrate-binding protein